MRCSRKLELGPMIKDALQEDKASNTKRKQFGGSQIGI